MILQVTEDILRFITMDTASLISHINHQERPVFDLFSLKTQKRSPNTT